MILIYLCAYRVQIYSYEIKFWLLSKIIYAFSQLFYLLLFALLYTSTKSSVNVLYEITKNTNPPNSFHISIYIIFFTRKMLYQIICASKSKIKIKKKIARLQGWLSICLLRPWHSKKLSARMKRGWKLLALFHGSCLVYWLLQLVVPKFSSNSIWWLCLSIKKRKICTNCRAKTT